MAKKVITLAELGRRFAFVIVHQLWVVPYRTVNARVQTDGPSLAEKPGPCTGRVSVLSTSIETRGFEMRAQAQVDRCLPLRLSHSFL
jgi:hypothetical protein